MTRPLRLTLALAGMCLAAHLCASDALAQQGDATPTLTTDDIPTMTTEDAPSAAPAAPAARAETGVAADDVDRFWRDVYAQLERTPEVPPGDAAQFRSLIESGREVSLAMTFDIAAGGAVENFVLEESTGIASLDASLRALAAQRLPSVKADVRGVRVEAGISRQRARFALALDAPSVEEAEQFERAMNAARNQVSLGPAQRELLDGVLVSRAGQRVRVDLDLPISALVSAAAR